MRSTGLSQWTVGDAMTELMASCACGQVAFRLSAPPTMMATCHCSRCRKVGASTFVFVTAESFAWIKGQDVVRRFVAEPPYRYDRHFCGTCGTALGEPGVGASFPVNAQCFDSALPLQVQFHEFVGDKPDWYAICDQATQYVGHPVKGDPSSPDQP